MGRDDSTREESTPPVTAAFFLAFAPQYLTESLLELAPLVERYVFILLSSQVNRDRIIHQARAVLGDRSIHVQDEVHKYIDGLNTAIDYAAGGWLLVLEGDECVDQAAFAQALTRLPQEPGRRYTVPTHFFWHDAAHVIEGPAWQRASEKPRLLWATEGERLDASGRPQLPEGAPAPAELEPAQGWAVFNYSHAVPADIMRKRLGKEEEQIDASSANNPSDWFSPWWALGVNRLPHEVKRYEGPHPAAMARLREQPTIHDIPKPVPDAVSRPLIWEGWIGQEISYGVITDFTVRHLEEQGWQPHVHPVGLLGPASAVPAPTRRAIHREAERREYLKHHPSAIVVKNSHTGDWMQLQYPKAAVKIGYSPHERVALEPADVQRANRMDVVMVTSSYVQRVFQASGVRRPFYVYHHGYDPEYIRPIVRSERPVFTFLAITVLNLRKGPDLLLAAFDRVFARETDVRLVVKTSPHVWHEELHNQLMARYGNHPKITFLSRHHTDAEIAQLYYESDCLVLPTRGEGFGMPVLEAMATGLPVITTNWSGHLDFCTPENSYLIDVKNRDQLEFVMGCESWWAAPDEEHLEALLRHVYEHRDEARQRGQRAARDVADWTWQRQVHKLSQFLKSL